MSLIRADKVAEHQAYDATSEQWSPFEAGSKQNASLFGRYAYSEGRKYGSISVGGYTLNYPSEIDIYPKSGVMLVGIGIIEAPELITSNSGDIMLPERLKSVLIHKAMSVIGQNEGDERMITVNEQQVISLISAV